MVIGLIEVKNYSNIIDIDGLQIELKNLLMQNGWILILQISKLMKYISKFIKVIIKLF